MKKPLVALLFVMSIALASFLMHSGDAIAATRAPRVHKQAAFEYYTAYEGQVEWVLIPPQSLSANQTFWVEFPAACMDYTIPGQWEVISSDAIAYIPSSPLTNQYAGQQNLESTATADHWATQVAEENESIDANWQTLEQDKAVDDAADQGFTDPEAEASGIDDPANYDTSSDSGD